MKWTWQDVDAIASALAEHHPETDPLRLSAEEVRSLAAALPEFGDELQAADLATLEAIRAAWYEASEP
jgi:FeS assembly protein IscX